MAPVLAAYDAANDERLVREYEIAAAIERLRADPESARVPTRPGRRSHG